MILTRLLKRCGWFAGIGAGTLVAGLLVLVGAAQAAFPGRDGLLAVQPLKGAGIVLIDGNGHGARRVCAEPADGCFLAASGSSMPAGLARPEWSPDGRSLVLGGQQLGLSSPVESFASPDVIYPDGSCLDCERVTPSDAAFTNNPTLLAGVEPLGFSRQPALVEFGIDGLARRVLLSGPVSNPVWSSRGELAVQRRRWIWLGRPGKLHRLARGRSPSWSPDGSRIVFVRDGWLMTVRLRGRVRRLVRGTAPAWSPNGRWIAFFGERHRLSIVPVGGGRARRVGEVMGRAVDWQPVPIKPPAACLAPPNSTVAASDATAVVTASSTTLTSHGFDYSGFAFMGCLRADGRERLLLRYVPSTVAYAHESVRKAALAGPYAALIVNSSASKGAGGGQGSRLGLFDLRTGSRVAGRGGESAVCAFTASSTCAAEIDGLALGSDAVSAVHTTTENNNGCGCTVEQIQASDSTGVHTLDSITEPAGSPIALTNLTLSGDTLTWEHNGTPRSAQLEP